MQGFTRRLVLFAIGTMLWPSTLIAQSTATGPDEIIEEIVVRGIRSSLQQSLIQKRDRSNFVDAITAEDVGKLPDQNIAESLNRIPGVAIQRSRGEGDFVSIRGLGPDFVRGTINGRTAVSSTEAFDSTLSGGAPSSTGRATNFDILPSEIIRTLEVTKTPSAKHVEGGIGGVVNVTTARPFNLGNMYSGTLEGVYRDFSKEFDPRISGVSSWANDDRTLGFLASAAYSQRDIREDFSRSFGWLPFGTYDTDGDGLADRSNVVIPLSNNLDTFTESRERLTVSSTLQLSLGSASSVTMDALYSRRDLQHDQFGVILVSLPLGFPANADGSYQISPSDLDGNALTTIQGALPPEIISDAQDNKDELTSIGANFSRDVENWHFDADISLATAKGTLAFDRAVIVGNGLADGGTYAQDFAVNRGGFAVTNVGTASLSNPANYFVRNGRVTRASNDDEEFAIQFDLERFVEAGIVSSIETGIRYRSRGKARDRLDLTAR